ncbi:hypothetical protein [Gryllotalpicola ginsengisoli]|uniref:hypothetical protein n=1 Tax=Gryllotalpicola ginsengisoli TaxID=444608 RepID=UPI0003B4B22C|nr:hypothetical protein [Gryllotalpicola ginsengisoli]
MLAAAALAASAVLTGCAARAGGAAGAEAASDAASTVLHTDGCRTSYSGSSASDAKADAATEDAAQKLIDLVDPTQGGELVTADGEDYGFAGTVMSGSDLHVFWVGKVPSNVQQLLAPAGSHVHLHEAQWTLFEQERAGNRVGAELAEIDSRIQLVGPIAGQGICLSIAVDDGTAVPTAVLEKAERIAGMPVAAQAIGAGGIAFQPGTATRTPTPSR